MASAAKPATAEKTAHTRAVTSTRFVEGVGRRKTAVARVRLTAGGGEVTVNRKKLSDYFPSVREQQKVLAPFSGLQLENKYAISAQVAGGGFAAQAEAVRHGVARALVVITPSLKKKLRLLGFLTRDSRMVERKHYGLKKARRAPQWSKR